MSDRSSLTVAEVNSIFKAAAKERNGQEDGRVTALDRIGTPTLDHFVRQGRELQPTRGDYRADVKRERGQQLQAWSGRDELEYVGLETIFRLIFRSGRVHYGDEIPHQLLEEAGIVVDYSEAAKGIVRPWGEMPVDAKGICFNYISERMEDVENGFFKQLAREFYRANLSQPKMWVGADGLFPVTGNDTGLIGGKPRTDPLLRHVLKAGVAVDDLESELDDLVYQANLRNGQDGSGINYMPAGREVIIALRQRLYTGSSTITTLTERKAGLQESIARAQVGISDDVFFQANAGVGIVPDPVLEELDAEDAPAIPWTKRIYAFNDRHLKMFWANGKNGTMVIKPTPYNQQISYISIYGQYSLWTDKPNSQGVLYLA